MHHSILHIVHVTRFNKGVKYLKILIIFLPVDERGVLESDQRRVRVVVSEDTFPTTSFLHVISAGFKIIFIPKTRNRCLNFNEMFDSRDQILKVRFNKKEDQFLVASVFAKGKIFRELEKGKDMRICVDPNTYKLLCEPTNQKFILVLLHTIIDAIHGLLQDSTKCDSLGLAWLRFQLEHLNSYGLFELHSVHIMNISITLSPFDKYLIPRISVCFFFHFLSFVYRILAMYY